MMKKLLYAMNRPPYPVIKAPAGFRPWEYVDPPPRQRWLPILLVLGFGIFGCCLGSIGIGYGISSYIDSRRDFSDLYEPETPEATYEAESTAEATEATPSPTITPTPTATATLPIIAYEETATPTITPTPTIAPSSTPMPTPTAMSINNTKTPRPTVTLAVYTVTAVPSPSMPIATAAAALPQGMVIPVIPQMEVTIETVHGSH